MWRCVGLLGVVLALGGCQTTHEDLIAKGYPPAFADGFDDGCVSGRQAAGSISGEFRKNVPRYLKDQQYADGWVDGFANVRRCSKTGIASNIATSIGTNANAPGSSRRTRTSGGLIARNRSFADIR